MDSKIITELEQLNEKHQLYYVATMSSAFYDQNGYERKVHWSHLQHPVTGVDYYRVWSFDGSTLHAQWYDALAQSLQHYDETVLVHRENTLGDNAHPN